ncbi:unnamed protein product, partial [Staurois parvus]
WGPRAIEDYGAPVSLPKLKKAYEKEVPYTLNVPLAPQSHAVSVTRGAYTLKGPPPIQGGDDNSWGPPGQ